MARKAASPKSKKLRGRRNHGQHEPTALFAEFLSTRKDPDGGVWEFDDMGIQEKELFDLYKKYFRRAKVDPRHLPHIRRFKVPDMLATEEQKTDAYISEVCKSGEILLRAKALEPEEGGSKDISIPFGVEKLKTGFAPPGFAAPIGGNYSSTTMGVHMHERIRNWTGGWRKGKMTGAGEMTYADGTKADGLWRDNKLHGKGTKTFVSGAVYRGQFNEGCIDGEGTCTYPSGSRYEGQWKDGLRHGHGTMTFPSGQMYEGKFWKGDMHGVGKVVSSTGHIYEGFFKDGLICGAGKLKLLNGPRVMRSWPRCTLREAVDMVRTEMSIQKTVHKMEMDDLLGPVRRIRLDNYVQAVREETIFAAEEEIRMEKEGKREAEVQRRKAMIEAKKLALEEMSKSAGKESNSDDDDDETDSSDEEKGK